jgi:very-short-patch-repair endonuclease
VHNWPRSARALDLRFEGDRRRIMALRDAGYEVIRVTWRQLTDEPLRRIAHITRALRAGMIGYSSSASKP